MPITVSKLKVQGLKEDDTYNEAVSVHNLAVRNLYKVSHRIGNYTIMRPFNIGINKLHNPVELTANTT
jgi:hypothetical protein